MASGISISENTLFPQLSSKYGAEVTGENCFSSGVKREASLSLDGNQCHNTRASHKRIGILEERISHNATHCVSGHPTQITYFAF